MFYLNLYAICVPCAMGPEKGIKSLGIRGTDGFEATYGSSERSAGAINSQAISLVPILYFFLKKTLQVALFKPRSGPF